LEGIPTVKPAPINVGTSLKEFLELDTKAEEEAILLYKKIIEKIPSTLLICRFDNPQTSMWHSGCGQRTENNPDYVKGRRKLMAKLNVRKGE
ncbi:MAG: hypothetical protein ACP5QD_04710, partial [Candidatus Ratteibacteria bacterium]